jgi:hypothetical protein
MNKQQEEMQKNLSKARFSMIKAVRLASSGCHLLAKKELAKAKKLIDKQYANS